MRTKIAAAAFVLIGGGASIIAAGNPPINMQGSDTLFLLTQAINNVCPRTSAGQPAPLGINYIGSGSGNGQRNTLKTCQGTSVSPAAQTISPMSRFLIRDNTPTATNDICLCNQAHGAEGIAFALDGVGIISNTNTAPGSCGGVASTGKVINLDGGGTYTATDALDIIRVAWFGVLNTDPAGATPVCGGVVRRSLLSNYGNFFNAACPGGDAACPTGVRHLWRRDNGSGTTDVFTALVLPGGGSSAIQKFCNTNGGLTLTNGQVLGGTAKNGFDYQDNDPYRITCNGNGFTNPGEQVCGDAGQAPPPGALARRTPPVGTPAWLPGGQCIRAKRACVVNDDCRDFVGDTDTCAAGGRCTSKHLECTAAADCTAVVAGDFCGRHGTLGMLLSIFIPETVDVPPAETYPIGLCTAGVNALLPATKATYLGPCPTGSPSFGGKCFSSMFRPPAPAPLNANCITGFSGTRCPILTPAGTDCRGGNLWLRNPVGDLVVDSSIPSTRTAPPVPPAGRFMLGAFYRIHATTRMANGTAACARPSATEQIGCLASLAAPCSVGFAGRGGADVVPANLQNVGGVPNDIPSIQNLVNLGPYPGNPTTYPLARKLYLNTLTTFDAVTGEEQDMAQCFATEAITDPIIPAQGFVLMPVGGNGRKPRCEDFDEGTLGCTGTAVNACATNPGLIPTNP